MEKEFIKVRAEGKNWTIVPASTKFRYAKMPNVEFGHPTMEEIAKAFPEKVPELLRDQRITEKRKTLESLTSSNNELTSKNKELEEENSSLKKEMEDLKATIEKLSKETKASTTAKTKTEK